MDLNLDQARTRARLLLSAEKLRELIQFLETDIPALIVEVERLRLLARPERDLRTAKRLQNKVSQPKSEEGSTEGLLTVKQFAQALGITVACVRRWVLERKIQVVKLGRLVRIPRSEVERLIDEGTVPARALGGTASKSGRL